MEVTGSARQGDALGMNIDLISRSALKPLSRWDLLMSPVLPDQGRPHGGRAHTELSVFATIACTAMLIRLRPCSPLRVGQAIDLSAIASVPGMAPLQRV